MVRKVSEDEQQQRNGKSGKVQLAWYYRAIGKVERAAIIMIFVRLKQ